MSKTMMTLKEGDTAPAFTLKDADNNSVSLSDYLGKWVVLYFYPKDDTPGCTIEAKQFSEKLQEIEDMGVKVFGISPDSPESHCKFRDKYTLSVSLLSDTSHEMLENYGVWQNKKMFGKEYMGIARTTFLINPDGKIDHIWEKVKAEGHANEIKNYISQKA